MNTIESNPTPSPVRRKGTVRIRLQRHLESSPSCCRANVNAVLLVFKTHHRTNAIAPLAHSSVRSYKLGAWGMNLMVLCFDIGPWVGHAMFAKRRLDWQLNGQARTRMAWTQTTKFRLREATKPNPTPS
ncbi:hypothetical protein BCR44DRAFT_1089937 [Catenaria anguillulae PL171]|uniref:Uncharacterized protein n=1 Tax=Catenaria anguillulae PL171 TaxID=765915 RepID=A0A1Y2HQ55_9FUNG|nr:hypothetical protein BCR44DRAFT_1089937 [Catenaria anguillulae PL171]